LIGGENPSKPMSDNQIAKLLSEDGVQIARRTIAKYREAMNIASSSDRKKSNLVS
jgi:RNA polymerase sigma-54 factor